MITIASTGFSFGSIPAVTPAQTPQQPSVAGSDFAGILAREEQTASLPQPVSPQVHTDSQQPIPQARIRQDISPAYAHSAPAHGKSVQSQPVLSAAAQPELTTGLLKTLPDGEVEHLSLSAVIAKNAAITVTPTFFGQYSGDISAAITIVPSKKVGLGVIPHEKSEETIGVETAGSNLEKQPATIAVKQAEKVVEIIGRTAVPNTSDTSVVIAGTASPALRECTTAEADASALSSEVYSGENWLRKASENEDALIIVNASAIDNSVIYSEKTPDAALAFVQLAVNSTPRLFEYSSYFSGGEYRRKSSEDAEIQGGNTAGSGSRIQNSTIVSEAGHNSVRHDSGQAPVATGSSVGSSSREPLIIQPGKYRSEDNNIQLPRTAEVLYDNSTPQSYVVSNTPDSSTTIVEPAEIPEDTAFSHSPKIIPETTAFNPLTRQEDNKKAAVPNVPIIFNKIYGLQYNVLPTVSISQPLTFTPAASTEKNYAVSVVQQRNEEKITEFVRALPAEVASDIEFISITGSGKSPQTAEQQNISKHEQYSVAEALSEPLDPNGKTGGFQAEKLDENVKLQYTPKPETSQIEKPGTSQNRRMTQENTAPVLPKDANVVIDYNARQNLHAESPVINNNNVILTVDKSTLADANQPVLNSHFTAEVLSGNKDIAYEKHGAKNSNVTTTKHGIQLLVNKQESTGYKLVSIEPAKNNNAQDTEITAADTRDLLPAQAIDTTVVVVDEKQQGTAGRILNNTLGKNTSSAVSTPRNVQSNSIVQVEVGRQVYAGKSSDNTHGNNGGDFSENNATLIDHYILAGEESFASNGHDAEIVKVSIGANRLPEDIQAEAPLQQQTPRNQQYAASPQNRINDADPTQRGSVIVPPAMPGKHADNVGEHNPVNSPLTGKMPLVEYSENSAEPAGKAAVARVLNKPFDTLQTTTPKHDIPHIAATVEEAVRHADGILITNAVKKNTTEQQAEAQVFAKQSVTQNKRIIPPTVSEVNAPIEILEPEINSPAGIEEELSPKTHTLKPQVKREKSAYDGISTGQRTHGIATNTQPAKMVITLENIYHKFTPAQTTQYNQQEILHNTEYHHEQLKIDETDKQQHTARNGQGHTRITAPYLTTQAGTKQIDATNIIPASTTQPTAVLGKVEYQTTTDNPHEKSEVYDRTAVRHSNVSKLEGEAKSFERTNITTDGSETPRIPGKRSWQGSHSTSKSIEYAAPAVASRHVVVISQPEEPLQPQNTPVLPVTEISVKQESDGSLKATNAEIHRSNAPKSESDNTNKTEAGKAKSQISTDRLSEENNEYAIIAATSDRQKKYTFITTPQIPHKSPAIITGNTLAWQKQQVQQVVNDNQSQPIGVEIVGQQAPITVDSSVVSPKIPGRIYDTEPKTITSERQPTSENTPLLHKNYLSTDGSISRGVKNEHRQVQQIVNGTSGAVISGNTIDFSESTMAKQSVTNRNAETGGVRRNTADIHIVQIPENQLSFDNNIHYSKNTVTDNATQYPVKTLTEEKQHIGQPVAPDGKEKLPVPVVDNVAENKSNRGVADKKIHVVAAGDKSAFFPEEYTEPAPHISKAKTQNTNKMYSGYYSHYPGNITEASAKNVVAQKNGAQPVNADDNFVLSGISNYHETAAEIPNITGENAPANLLENAAHKPGRIAMEGAENYLQRQTDKTADTVEVHHSVSKGKVAYITDASHAGNNDSSRAFTVGNTVRHHTDIIREYRDEDHQTAEEIVVEKVQEKDVQRGGILSRNTEVNTIRRNRVNINDNRAKQNFDAEKKVVEKAQEQEVQINGYDEMPAEGSAPRRNEINILGKREESHFHSGINTANTPTEKIVNNANSAPLATGEYFVNRNEINKAEIPVVAIPGFTEVVPRKNTTNNNAGIWEISPTLFDASAPQDMTIQGNSATIATEQQTAGVQQREDVVNRGKFSDGFGIKNPGASEQLPDPFASDTAMSGGVPIIRPTQHFAALNTNASLPRRKQTAGQTETSAKTEILTTKTGEPTQNIPQPVEYQNHAQEDERQPDTRFSPAGFSAPTASTDEFDAATPAELHSHKTLSSTAEHPEAGHSVVASPELQLAGIPFVGTASMRAARKTIVAREYRNVDLERTPEFVMRLAGSTPSGGRTSAVLHLRPESLGSIALTVAVDGNRVGVTIGVETQEAQQAVAAQITVLREQLTKFGLTVQTLEIQPRQQDTSLAAGGGASQGGGFTRDDHENRQTYLRSFRNAGVRPERPALREATALAHRQHSAGYLEHYI